MYWIKKFFSDPAGHGLALVEVLIVSIFSLLFVSLPALRALGANVPIDGVKFFSAGQILALIYGQFGTIIWLSFVKWDWPRHTVRIFIGILGLLIVIPIIPYISFDPEFKTLTNPEALKISLIVYFIFLVLNYCLLFYLRIVPPSAETTLQRESRDMRDRYREMKGG